MSLFSLQEVLSRPEWVQRQNKVMITLGQSIKQHRETRGLTQVQLAELSGLTTTHIQKIEAGKRPGITLYTLARIARGLDITPAQLLIDVVIIEPQAVKQ